MATNHSQEHFNEVAKEWDKRRTSGQLAPLPSKLLAQIPLHKSDHVLDFGAGTGLLATAIAPYVNQVTALDTSTEMLKMLNEKGVSNIKTLEKNIFDGLPECYDLIVSSMAIHHVLDTQKLFVAFVNALNPNGRVALVDLVQEDGTFHGDNKAKGVQHFGFNTEKLSHIAQAAGLSCVSINEIHTLTRNHGREYPLFLLSGKKA